VGWDDLPGKVHRAILRLVPLRDATSARQVSWEMRDEVDQTWRAWGVRATAKDKREDTRRDFQIRHCVPNFMLYPGPVAVFAMGGSHAHHLASLGLWWLAMLVAEGPDFNGISWNLPTLDDVDQSPLMLAVRALRPAGRNADGRLQWEFAVGEEEAARMCGRPWRWVRTSTGGCTTHGRC